MDRIIASDLTDGRRQLLESLAGHLELLKSSHPQKAASATAPALSVTSRNPCAPSPASELRKVLRN